MPKSKHNRKRHDPNRRARRFFDRATIWTFEGLRDVNGKQLQTQGLLKTARGTEELAPRIISGIMRQPNNRWFLAVRAICMASDGKPWISFEYREISGQLHGTGNQYWELRDQVLAKQRTDHVYDIGWIAQNYSGSTIARDEERLDALLQFKLGFISDYRRDMWRQVNRDVMEDREAA